MCMCQGSQSTRQQTGLSCHNSGSPAAYVQPVKSSPGLLQIRLTCKQIIQLECVYAGIGQAVAVPISCDGLRFVQSYAARTQRVTGLQSFLP